MSIVLDHALPKALTAGLWLAVAALAVGCSCRNETDVKNNDPGSLDGDDDDDVTGDDDDDDTTDEGDTPPEDFGTWLSADIAPEGDRLGIAYYDPNREAAGYATVRFEDDGTPIIRHERVYGYDDDDDEVGGYTTQVTAPDGTAWVAFHDSDDDELVVRQRTSRDSWGEPETLGTGGRWANMGLGPNGQVIVAHTHTDGVLRVTYQQGDEWETDEVYSSAATDWTLPDGTVITRPAEVRQPRVYSDGNDVYVAFYDKAKGELHLLSGALGVLSDEVVAGGSDQGAWPSMATVDGKLVIAYQDLAAEDLVLATRNGTQWSFEVVDDGNLVGADTEVIEHGGQLNILYQDGFESDLFRAVDAGGWSTSRVEGGASAAGFHNEAVVFDGALHVITYDYTNRALVFHQF